MKLFQVLEKFMTSIPDNMDYQHQVHIYFSVNICGVTLIYGEDSHSE
jgi:hypothetical protein